MPLSGFLGTYIRLEEVLISDQRPTRVRSIHDGHILSCCRYQNSNPRARTLRAHRPVTIDCIPGPRLHSRYPFAILLQCPVLHRRNPQPDFDTFNQSLQARLQNRTSYSSSALIGIATGGSISESPKSPSIRHYQVSASEALLSPASCRKNVQRFLQLSSSGPLLCLIDHPAASSSAPHNGNFQLSTLKT